MSDAAVPETASRFDGLGDAYDRYRPTYPAAAIATILEGLGDHPRIVDVGAGTGISSRALRDAGAQVIAVEPNDDMRAFAVASGVDARRGTATATGLPAECADAVTSFQAFHWFAHAAALAEFRRILRPGGRIALVWNERDTNDPFTRELRDLEARTGEAAMLAGIEFKEDALEPLLRSAGFEPLRVQRYEHVQITGEAGLNGRVRSLSFAPRSGPSLDALVAALATLYERYADSAGNVTIRYRTEVIVGDLDASDPH